MPYIPRFFGAPVWVDVVSTGTSSGPSSALPGTFFGSGSIIPVVFSQTLPSSSWYTVGGVLLDVQPTVCTAPLPHGSIVLAGSTFVLLFSNYTAVTQSLLPDGGTVTLRFLLYGGSTATGSVQLASTISGGILQVICSVLTSIPISLS